MKIEILYPEFCNLNGDMGNMKYLEKCIPEAEIIETSCSTERQPKKTAIFVFIKSPYFCV